MKRINQEKTCLFIVELFIAVAFGAMVWVNLFHYTYNMNADIASEGILARLIWESKEWVPDSWYVAAETRVFDMANLAALIYGISRNMVFSTGLACVLLTLGILASAYYLTACLKLQPVSKGVFLLTCVALPNNPMILELMYLQSSYYAPHTIVLFITLGIYARVLEGRFSPFAAIAAILLEFMLGVQSVRGILIVAGPVMAVEVFRNLYLFYRKTRPGKEDFCILIWSVLLVVSGFLGGLLPFSTGQVISRNIRKAPQKLWEQVIPDILKAMGAQDAEGIEWVFLVGIYAVLVISLCILIGRFWGKEEIEVKDWIFMVLIAGPAAAAAILTFTTVGSSGRYFYGIIFAAALAAALLWEKQNRIGKYICMIWLCGIFVLHFHKIYIPVLGSEEPPQNEIRQVVDYLEEEGYEQGYATFLQANTMTIYTNGRIRVAAIDQPSRMNVCKWLTSTDWYVPNVDFEEKTAYIVTEHELEDFMIFLNEHSDTVWKETQIGKYHIYGSNYNYSILE